MSRLIDADKLIDEIARNIPIGTSQQDLEWSARVAQSFVNIIDNQPTVIDMCKVIGYLEKLKNRAEKQESIERYIAYDRAIDIVRGRWD